jgi:hypothetical protein
MLELLLAAGEPPAPDELRPGSFDACEQAAAATTAQAAIATVSNFMAGALSRVVPLPMLALCACLLGRALQSRQERDSLRTRVRAVAVAPDLVSVEGC